MSPDRKPQAPVFVLLTCEHGGREVPAPYKRQFRGAKAILDSHRGYDPGALGVALRMASRLPAPIIFSTVTRLLIDLNRSLDQPDTFSEFTRELSEADRSSIIASYYAPHRERVEQVAAVAIASGHRVLHVGVHSCVDELKGSKRDLDVALLFDEARPLEQELCERWQHELSQQDGGLRYPFNVPYRGADDGLTTALRSRFKPREYLGIEVELRQGMVGTKSEQRAAGELLASTLRTLCETMLCKGSPEGQVAPTRSR